MINILFIFIIFFSLLAGISDNLNILLFIKNNHTSLFEYSVGSYSLLIGIYGSDFIKKFLEFYKYFSFNIIKLCSYKQLYVLKQIICYTNINYGAYVFEIPNNTIQINILNELCYLNIMYEITGSFHYFNNQLSNYVYYVYTKNGANLLNKKYKQTFDFKIRATFK